VVVMPPLAIAAAEVDLLLEALHASIKEVTEA
jgi:adenosylmethionine-8-amino-7-oxononanoate aminotransferase